jgi:alanine racemase
MNHSFYRDTYIEVDLDSIQHNVAQFRRILPSSINILVAVKADAYGHGAIPVSHAALSAGATHLGVAFVDEGIQLRKATIQAPILIFGYTPPHAIEKALSYNLTLTVYDEMHIRLISDAAKKLGLIAKVHLKVDTGMGRLGIEPSRAISFINQVENGSNVEIEGIYTHFATSDDLESPYFEQQMEQFESLLQQLHFEGIQIPIRHSVNSAGALRIEQTKSNLVRIGIGLYGFQDIPRSDIELRPVLSLKSKISQLKQPSKGSGVSYGKTHTTMGEEWIATIPIGYADGIPRQLSNLGVALVNGVRVPFAGRVCMDQLMLDVTKAMPVAIGDEVVFIGDQGNEQITPNEIAKQLNTIHYEVITRLGARLPRLYYQNEKLVAMNNQLHTD